MMLSITLHRKVSETRHFSS